MSLYISTIRWRNKKHCSARKQKITVRKVLSDYNLTTKMDMPGRQTFLRAGHLQRHNVSCQRSSLHFILDFHQFDATD